EDIEMLLEGTPPGGGQPICRARLALDERLLEVDVTRALEDTKVPREVPVREPEEGTQLEVVDLPPRREDGCDREPRPLVDHRVEVVRSDRSLLAHFFLEGNSAKAP